MDIAHNSHKKKKKSGKLPKQSNRDKTRKQEKKAVKKAEERRERCHPKRRDSLSSCSSSSEDEEPRISVKVITRPPCPPPEPTVPTADYVIVGAGAAGSLLANRLVSRGPKGTTVLLLEAGVRRLDDPNIVNPLGFYGVYNAADQNISLPNDPKFAWQTLLAPDKGRYNIREPIANGRQWGGGGAINNMIYVNGGKTGFDQDWPVGWHYEDVKPYFAEIAAEIAPLADTVKLLPTQVFLDAMKNLAEAQLAAGGTDFLTNVETGNTTDNIENSDPNAPLLDYNDLPGVNSVCAFSGYQYFINRLADGTYVRKHSGNTYLGASQVDPATGEGIGALEGLTVVSEAFVDRVLFADVRMPGAKPRATGVLYVDGAGESRTVMARKEVIVSGGAFQTPTILQRSGVGDLAYLASIGVPRLVASNLEVGQNLRNDFSPISTLRVLGEPAAVAAFMQRIYVPQPNNLGFHGGAYLNFHPLDPNKPTNYQEVSYRKYQLFFFGSSAVQPGYVQAQYGVPSTATNLLSFAVDDVRFEPVGYVRAALPNGPFDTPHIFFNTFVAYVPTAALPDEQWPAVQTTLAPVISAILGYDIVYQIQQQMIIAAADRSLGVGFEFAVPTPGNLIDELHDGLALFGDTWWHYLVPALAYPDGGTPEQVAFAATLAELQLFVRTAAHIDSHQMSTSSMGAATDTDLRVFGTDALRVVDLSVAPKQTGGNTAAPAMMIANASADRILGLLPLQ